MDFTGKYELISSERFDDYLAAVGVSLIKRGVAATMKPTLEISQQGEKITIKTFSKLKNTEINFTPGVEFDEETADGRNAKVGGATNYLNRFEGFFLLPEARGSLTGFHF